MINNDDDGKIIDEINDHVLPFDQLSENLRSLDPSLIKVFKSFPGQNLPQM